MAGPRQWLVSAPYAPVLAVACWFTLWSAAHPIDDIDSYWHVVIGEEILATGNTTALGDDWAIFDSPTPWVTSQWLSEVVMAASVDLFGWRGLVLLTLLATAALLGVVLWVAAFRGRSRVSLLFLALFVASLALFVQTRPLLASAVATAAVGHSAARMLYEGRLPPWWSIPLVALWANMHGQWVIAPAAIGLASALHWLGNPRARLRPFLRALIRTLAMAFAGLLTPLGIDGVLLPLQLRSAAADFVAEWGTTEPWNLVYLPLAVMVALIVASWVREGPVHPPEVAYTLMWLTFSTMAWRNILVSMLLLLPVTMQAVERMTGSLLPRDRTRPAVLAAVSVAGAAAVAASTATLDPLDKAMPLAIARELADRPGVTRVLNDYNAAGVLVAFGPAGIQLGIDGRAERYGEEYIRDYFDMLNLRGAEWDEGLRQLDPDVAVVLSDQAIRHVLEDDLGWERTVVDGDYLLLERPVG